MRALLYLVGAILGLWGLLLGFRGVERLASGGGGVAQLALGFLLIVGAWALFNKARVS
jgi:hypothetical protein